MKLWDLPLVGGEVQMLQRIDAKPGSISSRNIGVYKPTPVYAPSKCEHIHTICAECFDTWQVDWIIQKFDHATVSSYRTYGCRCVECRSFASDDHKRV